MRAIRVQRTNTFKGSALDSQIIELLGRNRLVDELMRAGLEVAIPIRDRGVDLIAYADLESKVASFVACPIQMKASSLAAFGIDQKYQKFPGLILAHVWYLHDGQQTRTYATTYAEALDIGDQMGWTKTASWAKGAYSTSRPGSKLQSLLEPFRMTPEKWWVKVTQAGKRLVL
jgi:hypothetical protein